MNRVSLVASSFALLGALHGCGTPPTEIVVRVTEDGLGQGMFAPISQVDIDVHYESSTGASTPHTYTLSGTSTQPLLPQDLGIVPRDGNTSEAVIIDVTARSAVDVTMTQHARVHFDPGHIVRLVIPLSSLCAGAACGPMQYCGTAGTCGSWDSATVTRVDDDPGGP